MDGGTGVCEPSRGVLGETVRSAPALHVALPFSERRALLIVGDAFLVNGAGPMPPFSGCPSSGAGC